MFADVKEVPYMIGGLIIFGFGAKWCYESAQIDYLITKNSMRSNRSSRRKGCMSHPSEGIAKLLATGLGICATLFSGLTTITASSSVDVISPGVIYATVYLFFAISGLVDVLRFYFPMNFSEGLEKLALGQSFLVEGLLLVWANVGFSQAAVNAVLAGVVWTASVAIIFEWIYPEIKLLRAFATMLHGSWLAHMLRFYPREIFSTQRIILAFTWHVALVFVIVLGIVAFARMRMSKKAASEPPEVPIYDYCQQNSVQYDTVNCRS